MKYYKILILSIIPALILIQGCEKEYHWQYIIINETDFMIRIEGYDRINIANNGMNENIEHTVEIINISPNQEYSLTRARGYHPDPIGIFENMGIDSVNIYFDEEKVTTQFCDNETSLQSCIIERNINGYETDYEKVKIGRSSGENEYRYTYTITEEDYNNAEPIEN